MKTVKLIISSYDDLKNPYFAGGGAQAVHAVAKRLVKQQMDVTVITGRYPHSKNEIIDGVTYIRTGTSFLGAQVDQFIFQLCLPFYILTKQFDCWMESFTPPFSTTFLQLFTNKPVIGLVHMLSGEDMKRKYKLPFDLIERIGLKTYKQLIVTSDAIKQKIKKITQAKIAVISNGIESVTIKNYQTQRKYILFLGRIEVNQKGLDLLINAYAQVADKTEIPLHIVGSGEPREEAKLKKLIEEAHLGKKLVCKGRVSGVEKETVYNEASIIVIPSRFETFSAVALEAMAHARAIVCFDIDGLQWIPNNAAIKVKPFDEKALGETFLKVIDNQKEAEKMGNAGKTYAKQYTWDTITKEYLKVIKESMK